MWLGYGALDRRFFRVALQGADQSSKVGQFYHQSGIVNIECTGLGRRMIQTSNDLSVARKAEIVRPEDLRKRYPLYWDADYREAMLNEY